jgi:hypothetical protein
MASRCSDQRNILASLRGIIRMEHQLFFVNIVTFVLGTMLVKLSLFSLYYRLFARASTFTRRLIYVGSVLVILFYPSMGIAMVGLCAPRRGEDFVRSGFFRRAASASTTAASTLCRHSTSPAMRTTWRCRCAAYGACR